MKKLFTTFITIFFLSVNTFTNNAQTTWIDTLNLKLILFHKAIIKFKKCKVFKTLEKLV